MAATFKQRLEHVLIKEKWPYSLKTEQVEALKNVFEGKHTLCLLPTGFGKSDLFALSSMITDPVSFFYMHALPVECLTTEVISISWSVFT